MSLRSVVLYMRQSYDLSISEENKKVAQIIKYLRQKRFNVSDRLCKYIIEGFDTDMIRLRVEADMDKEPIPRLDDYR